MPKTMGSGQALSMRPEQLDSILSEASPKMRAVFSTCRFTACRVSEALQLSWGNWSGDSLVFPKRLTKGKLKTRTLPVNARLAEALRQWRTAWTEEYGHEPSREDYMFPGRAGLQSHFSRKAVDTGLRTICAKIGIEGASTHSFRRSALTAASSSGVTIPVLRTLSGHSSMACLQKYIDIDEDARKKAAMMFA